MRHIFSNNDYASNNLNNGLINEYNADLDEDLVEEAAEEQSAAQCVPHDPHPGPICRTYGQQEFSVYKFVPPPTTTPPHSSKLFALKILTKELSQMPECLHAQTANSCCSKRMRFLH